MPALHAFACALFLLTETRALVDPIYYVKTNAIPDISPQQHSECREAGGTCAPLGNCPTRHILNLPSLGQLCGESGDSVCCKPLIPNNKEVLQVSACNDIQAFCTWNALCPEESRVGSPLLCDEQEDVTCCSTGLAKKRSFEFPRFSGAPVGVDGPSFKRNFVKLQAVGIFRNGGSQNPKVDGVDPSFSLFKLGAQHVSKKSSDSKDSQANTNDHRPEGSGSHSGDGPSVPHKAGAVERSRAHAITERTCFQEGGLCLLEEHCPEDDVLGPPDMCGFQNFYACCKASNLTLPKPE